MKQVFQNRNGKDFKFKKKKHNNKYFSQRMVNFFFAIFRSFQNLKITIYIKMFMKKGMQFELFFQ